MSEFLQNDSYKQAKLKEIIKSLHDGKPVEQVKKDFEKLIKNVSPEEISAMENALIQEGFPVEEVQRLCDVHVAVFDASLKKYKSPKKMPGHPVHTYKQENKEAKTILKRLKKLTKKTTSQENLSELKKELEKISLIELHFTRKENQLFPRLEKTGFTGPSKVMWGKHDEIRAMLKKAKTAVEGKDTKLIKNSISELISAIKNMIFMEEKILYPTSLRKLTDQDWIDIKREEPLIGYAWVKPGNLWDINIARSKQKHPIEENIQHKKTEEKTQTGVHNLDTGKLTTEQINLMLKNLPIDVTFVDKNDKVLYYSEGRERIFPRSPSIIGRDVQNCHPPKSVHIVNRIVESFKKKEKDIAEFWLTINDKFIHIRYFPIYDDKGEYQGVIEVSQDVTEIRALEGERRLLDW
ncbi:DUF438 domain-containing protein [Spirochaetia bacterium 38H-sp]|uniref:DUF438 domain-containing protein n=1 Tax=Rarispira pelagica TaxID=3141764 RepID=A0ABU9UBU0_9SPIR